MDWTRSSGIRSSIAKVVAVGALIAIPALNTAIPAHGAPAPLDNPTDPDCAPDPANPLNPRCLRPNRDDSPSFDPPFDALPPPGDGGGHHHDGGGDGGGHHHDGGGFGGFGGDGGGGGFGGGDGGGGGFGGDGGGGGGI